MKYIALIFLIALSACAPKSSGSGDAPAGIKSTKFARVVAYGDSITVGIGANEGFAQRVANGLGLSIENHAVGGTVIAETLPVIQIYPPSAKDCVLYLMGMNDVIHNGDDRAKLETYLSNLKQAWDIFESSGAEAYVGLPLRLTLQGMIFEAIEQMPMTAYTPELYSQSITALYYQQNYKHVHLVDTHSGYIPTDDNSKDGVHPNDIGASIIANVFLTAIGN